MVHTGLRSIVPISIDRLDDSNGIAVWPRGDYFPRIPLDFLGKGRARAGTVGDCTAELLDGAAFTAFAARWMECALR